MSTIANNRFPVGNPENFRNLTKGKYSCYVYQGDKGDEQFMESCGVPAKTWAPTGSVAFIDGGTLSVDATKITEKGGVKVSVPYMVKVGTEHKTVGSEKYNAAGGLVTLLPLTGYFRFVTTVYQKVINEDTPIVYNAGDLLTLAKFEYDGQEVIGVTKATAATNLIVGIVDGQVGKEVKQNDALAFTAYYRPATA